MRGMRVWGMLALLALAIMPTGGRGAVAETVEVYPQMGHTVGVSSFAFSPDGRFVLSASDETAQLWDAATGREIRRFAGHTGWVNSVAFSPDGRFVLSASGETTRLWDAATGREIRRFEGHRDWVTQVAYSPDGQFALTGTGYRSLRLWNTATGKEIRRFEGHKSVAFSPDGRFVLTGDRYETTWLWDTATGKEIRDLIGHARTVSSVAFSPDGRLILTGSHDNTARLWDTATGKEIRGLIGHARTVSSVAFSPDGRFVLTGSYDKTTRLWDTATGKEIRRFEGDSTSANSVAFSPDGRTVLTGSDDKTARLWDAATGKEIRRLIGHSDDVNSVAFSPDGRTVLTGSDDNTARLWDTATGREIRRFDGHTYDINSVAFSPDGKLVLTGGSDGSARLWSAATGKELVKLIGFTDGEWIAITPQGYYAASAAGDKHLNVRVDNDNAKVYGIDQYRAVFHRPDIVEAALRSGDGAQAIDDVQGARERPSLAIEPPFVVVKSPDDGATVGDKAALRLHVEDRGRAVEQLKVFVNGRPVNVGLPDGARGLQRVDAAAKRTEFSLDVPIDLDPGVNRIEIAAFNGVAEGRRALSLTSAGKAAALPDLWLLAIGVDAYDDKSIQSLRFAAADARAIAATFKQQEGRLFRKVHTRIIADGGDAPPTRDGLLDNLGFLRQAGQHDFAVLFIAGHGVNDPRGQYHFLPRDAAFEADGAPRRSRAITWRDLRDAVDLPARTLILADTCHSEGVSGRTATRSVNNDRFVKDLQDARAVIFTAARGSELSQERADLGHGVFTHALIAGLGGAAELIKDGKITMKELDAYVSQEVPRLTGGAQHPITDTPDGYSDFPIARP